jgi:hypothetical protein
MSDSPTTPALTTIPTEVLDAPVEGLNLRGSGTLAGEIGDRPALLVFLRHFGCIFCREMVRDLRKLAEDRPDYPPLIFVYQGTAEDGRTFFGEFHPAARAIADAPKKFYTAFGLRRASFGQMFGIQVWTCSFRAMSKGNFVGKPVGDPWLMPGAFLVHGADVLWSHHFAHQGDHPDWDAIPAKVPAAAPTP